MLPEVDASGTAIACRGSGRRRDTSPLRALLSTEPARITMTNNTNNDSSGERQEAAPKKPYEAPDFRYERVFEVSALSWYEEEHKKT
jgi:hypothetical protein